MCCSETNQMQQLEEVIKKYKSTQGALIPVLHEAQDIFGYLPPEVMKRVARGLEIPEAKVYGVATFYSQLSLAHKGKYRVSVCLGTACYVKGAADILDKLKERLMIEVGECTEDGLFSLDSCRCIGACSLAPILTVTDEGYGRLTVDDIAGIISKYEQMEGVQGA